MTPNTLYRAVVTGALGSPPVAALPPARPVHRSAS